MIKAKPEWTKTIPTKCQYCGQNVFYYENSFGSKVFFDELGKPWPRHECGYTANCQKEIEGAILEDLNSKFDEYIHDKSEFEFDFDLGNDFNFDEIEYSENEQIKQRPEHELRNLSDRSKFRKKAKYQRQNKDTRKVLPTFQQKYDIGFIRYLEKNVDILQKEKIDETELNYSTLPKKWIHNRLVKINIVTHDVFDEYYYSYTGYALQNDLENMREDELVSFKVKGEEIAFGTMVWSFHDINLI